jgi:hypothetical protein
MNDELEIKEKQASAEVARISQSLNILASTLECKFILL